VALAAVAGCGRRDASAEAGAASGTSGGAAARDAGALDAGALDAGTRAAAQVKTSVRCRECHGKMASEWKGSAHAGSAADPVYLAMRGTAGVDGAACDRCHVPLAEYAPAAPAAREGVTCDVCHTLRPAPVGPEGPLRQFHLAVDDMVKYGPLCDAKDHYFHRMGCSPVHERASFCAACHQREIRVGGGGLKIYTTYEEWAAGPDAADDVQCQSCHMPGDRAEVAEGEGERDGVPHHGFLGRDRDLRQQALELEAAVAGGGRSGPLVVVVTVENSGAGHMVPTGFPGRRVALRVRVLDAAAQLVDSAERGYQRRLVDDTGAEVPYTRAIRVADDNRLKPRERRAERFQLTAPGGGRGTVEIALVWQALSPPLATALHVRKPDEEVMATLTLPYPPRPGRRRTGATP
jgi:cytochrome c554/c'-like protein